VIYLSTAYLPPTAWFALANQAVGRFGSDAQVFLEHHEHYQKGSWRNRCQISGPNGIQMLSIPLKKGKNSGQAIKEVQISYDEPWQRNHWRSIQAAYGNAPFFEHYSDTLLRFYEKPYTFLFDFNLALIDFSLHSSKIALNLQATDTYQKQVVGLDLRHADEAIFASKVLPYPQVFEDRFGFIDQLSILDLIFCMGPASGQYLAKVTPV
jgi:hypothetical protein